jgi:hypothetical protein
MSRRRETFALPIYERCRSILTRPVHSSVVSVDLQPEEIGNAKGRGARTSDQSFQPC